MPRPLAPAASLTLSHKTPVEPPNWRIESFFGKVFSLSQTTLFVVCLNIQSLFSARNQLSLLPFWLCCVWLLPECCCSPATMVAIGNFTLWIGYRNGNGPHYCFPKNCFMDSFLLNGCCEQLCLLVETQNTTVCQNVDSSNLLLFHSKRNGEVVYELSIWLFLAKTCYT